MNAVKVTKAVKELRKGLDERGVSHVDHEDIILWGHPVDNATGKPLGVYMNRATAMGDDRLFLEVQLATPEKAIAATVGAGTCVVDVLNTADCAGYECSEYIMHCKHCQHEYGYVQYNEDGDVWMDEPPKFCPNCGRRIEAKSE